MPKFEIDLTDCEFVEHQRGYPLYNIEIRRNNPDGTKTLVAKIYDPSSVELLTLILDRRGYFKGPKPNGIED